jgi:sulfonate transport system permease protein
MSHLGADPIPSTAGARSSAPGSASAAGSARGTSPRGPRPIGPRSRRSTTIIGGAILPLLLLIAWQGASSLGITNESQFPSPESVFLAGVDLAQRGQLGLYVAISTQRVFLGFAIGASIGLFIGAIVGLSRTWNVLLAPTLGGIRAVPSLAWVPLLILWLKIGEESKITLVAIGAFFPVYTTVAAALRHVDRQLVEAGRAFGLNGAKLFLTVQLPAVLPAVIAGLRLALAQAWLFLVAAELIAASMGLGFLLSESGNNGRIDRIFLAILLLAVLGKASDALLGVFEKLAARRWG